MLQSLALRMLSLFERMSSRGMSSMSLMEYVAREEYGGELINVTLCDGFFDCASVFSKSVAELIVPCIWSTISYI